MQMDTTVPYCSVIFLTLCGERIKTFILAPVKTGYNLAGKGDISRF
jgi:hypothetical protein